MVRQNFRGWTTEDLWSMWKWPANSYFSFTGKSTCWTSASGKQVSLFIVRTLPASKNLHEKVTAKYLTTPNPKIKLRKPERKKSGGENTGSLKQQKEKICIVLRSPEKKTSFKWVWARYFRSLRLVYVIYSFPNLLFHWGGCSQRASRGLSSSVI